MFPISQDFEHIQSGEFIPAMVTNVLSVESEMSSNFMEGEKLILEVKRVLPLGHFKHAFLVHFKGKRLVLKIYKEKRKHRSMRSELSSYQTAIEMSNLYNAFGKFSK